MKRLTSPWTSNEIDFLCKVYPYMRVSEIAKCLTKHTPAAIYRKANILMLRSIRTQHEEEPIILSMRQQGFSIKEICKRMGYHRNTISRRINSAMS